MRHPRAAAGIDALVREAIEPVVRQAAVAIARAVAEVTARGLEMELEAGMGRVSRRPSSGRARSRPRKEITRWAADRRARRVPSFVIETTGLKTKKQIVAKFGDGAVFEKGKPAPKGK